MDLQAGGGRRGIETQQSRDLIEGGVGAHDDVNITGECGCRVKGVTGMQGGCAFEEYQGQPKIREGDVVQETEGRDLMRRSYCRLPVTSPSHPLMKELLDRFDARLSLEPALPQPLYEFPTRRPVGVLCTHRIDEHGRVEEHAPQAQAPPANSSSICSFITDQSSTGIGDAASREAAASAWSRAPLE